MPTSPIVILLILLTVAICVAAFLRGGTAERIGAGIILANLVIPIICNLFLPPEVGAIVQLVNDAVTALGLLVISVISASPWMGGVMLLYGLQFTLHSFYFVTERPRDRLHVVVNNLDFLAISICLAIGVALAWRQRILRERAAREPQA
jgi:hypothetical protein